MAALTIPNTITAVRMLLGLGAAFVYELGPRSPATAGISLTLFGLSVALDYWDGYAARSMGLASVFGKHFDRITDQIVLWSNFMVLSHAGMIYPLLLCLAFARESLICEIWNYGDLLCHPIKVHTALHLRYLLQVGALASCLTLPLLRQSSPVVRAIPNTLLGLSVVIGGVTLGICIKENLRFLMQQR